MKLNLTSRAYDIIKFLCTRLLPAAGTLYFALSKVWGWPCSEEVVATITAICTFLGEVMAISSKNYYEEEQEMAEELEEEDISAMAINDDIEVVYAEGDEDLPEALTEEELVLEAENLKD